MVFYTCTSMVVGILFIPPVRTIHAYGTTGCIGYQDEDTGIGVFICSPLRVIYFLYGAFATFTYYYYYYYYYLYIK